jgi:hypothetical protein
MIAASKGNPYTYWKGECMNQVRTSAEARARVANLLGTRPQDLTRKLDALDRHAFAADPDILGPDGQGIGAVLGYSKTGILLGYLAGVEAGMGATPNGAIERLEQEAAGVRAELFREHERAELALKALRFMRRSELAGTCGADHPLVLGALDGIRPADAVACAA